MADTINRIAPSTIAPERYPVSRRERDEKNRKESQHRSQQDLPAFPATDSADARNEISESNNDKTKGRILDIDA
jgi:hypothetical protein